MNQLTFQDELRHRQLSSINDKLAELDRRLPAGLVGWFFSYDAGLYTLHRFRKSEPNIRTDAYPLPDLAIRAAMQIAAFYELLPAQDLALSNIFQDNICHWPPFHYLGDAPVSRVIDQVRAFRALGAVVVEQDSASQSWGTLNVAPAAQTTKA